MQKYGILKYKIQMRDIRNMKGKKKIMKSVILIAAPAAGKGTEAALLKEQYNMPHISF